MRCAVAMDADGSNTLDKGNSLFYSGAVVLIFFTLLQTSRLARNPASAAILYWVMHCYIILHPSSWALWMLWALGAGVLFTYLLLRCLVLTTVPN